MGEACVQNNHISTVILNYYRINGGLVAKKMWYKRKYPVDIGVSFLNLLLQNVKVNYLFENSLLYFEIFRSTILGQK